jgi:hypothetical protein
MNYDYILETKSGDDGWRESPHTFATWQAAQEYALGWPSIRAWRITATRK